MIKTKTKHDERHGGPYDRGSADAWYRRACVPHYYEEGTHTSELVKEEDMTKEEVEAYTAGWDDGMEWGEHKDWG
jgi:hypothetical protein